MLQDELKELIEEKARCEDGPTCLHNALVCSKLLNEHINGRSIFPQKEIKTLLDTLVGELTITLETISLVRARKTEASQKHSNFQKVSELSYIKNTTTTFPKTGRLNLQGEALFYASIQVTKCDKNLRTIFSEAGAVKDDNLNILYSKLKNGEDLITNFIGIWDYVQRGQKPYFLPDNIFNYYCLALDYMRTKFSTKQFTAYLLCDAFLADVLSRNGSDRLYQITSILSSYYLESSKVEGILYSSVQAKGEPVIAITPSAIDKKIDHIAAKAVLINGSWGYNLYDYTITSSGTLNTGHISWMSSSRPHP